MRTIPTRDFHNTTNATINGFSGNDMNEFMDRASKELRSGHRVVGHDWFALIQMLLLFKDKYTPSEIIKTWSTHKLLDDIYSGIQNNVKRQVKNYGKKKPKTLWDKYKEIEKLKGK